MKRRFWKMCLFLFCLYVTVSRFSLAVCERTAALRLSYLEPENSDFREQRLSERSLSHLIKLKSLTDMEISDLLTVVTAQGGGNVPDPARRRPQDYERWKRILQEESRENYERVRAAYAAVWDDVKCFPATTAGISYENSWMFERTYGGRRGHEGTDVMPPENLSGHYRIVSMTDGVVEQIGWLPKGGWRIGIRSPAGGYFYYAHLDSYSRDFRIGDTVAAGTELGRMGDTGYGEAGTRGKFDVHLHLGIYIRTERTQEVSVNPYWVLRYAQLLNDEV